MLPNSFLEAIPFSPWRRRAWERLAAKETELRRLGEKNLEAAKELAQLEEEIFLGRAENYVSAHGVLIKVASAAEEQLGVEAIHLWRGAQGIQLRFEMEGKLLDVSQLDLPLVKISMEIAELLNLSETDEPLRVEPSSKDSPY